MSLSNRDIETIYKCMDCSAKLTGKDLRDKLDSVSSHYLWACPYCYSFNIVTADSVVSQITGNPMNISKLVDYMDAQPILTAEKNMWKALGFYVSTTPSSIDTSVLVTCDGLSCSITRVVSNSLRKFAIYAWEKEDQKPEAPIEETTSLENALSARAGD